MRSAALAAVLVLAGCDQGPPSKNRAEHAAAASAAPVGRSQEAAPPAPAPVQAAAATPNPAEAEKHFQALGTEPFWSLEVLPGKLVYTSPEVQHGVVIAARFSGEGKRLLFSGTMQGKPVVLSIEPGTCSDGMSDTVHAYKAVFTWGAQTEQGCARLK